MIKSTRWLLAGLLTLSGAVAMADNGGNSGNSGNSLQLSLTKSPPALLADQGVGSGYGRYGNSGNSAAYNNGPVMPGSENSGSNTGHVHISTNFVYVNSYWFRYQNLSPNTFNAQNNTQLTVGLGRLGDVYVRSFVDVSTGVQKRYTNAYGMLANRFGGDVSGPVPTSDFQEIDFTAGYHKKFIDLVDFDAGVTMFINPTNIETVTPTGTVAGISHGQTLMQEAYVKVALDDSRYLGNFALHPYVFVGFDYTGNYQHGAGQYFQVGVSPVFTIPNTGGLRINPYANAGFIHDEKLLDRNLTSTRDGYLGVTGGVSVDYPLNALLHIPAGYGTYSIGGFVEYIQAGSRYRQPTGSHSGETVAGGMISMSY